MGCTRLESADLSCPSPREDLPFAWRQDPFQGHRSDLLGLFLGDEDLGGSRDRPGMQRVQRESGAK